MSAPTTAPNATPNRWRNPLFLFVFVLASAAWSAVVGWFVWPYYNPVNDWLGRQHELLQELLTYGILILTAGIAISGFVNALGLADKVAGIRPVVPPGRTHGRHAKWTPPK
jgi:hypothetical protein